MKRAKKLRAFKGEVIMMDLQDVGWDTMNVRWIRETEKTDIISELEVFAFVL